jgi:hypothetical protein
LELASTIIYSDREAAARKEKLSKPELCTRVRDVKPHFTIEQIRDMLDRLAVNHLFVATS